MFDLLGRGRLIDAFADEESFSAAPDQGGEASFGHQAGCADVAKIVLAAFHEGDESVAGQDEVGSNFRGDKLNPGGGKFFEPRGHIL